MLHPKAFALSRIMEYFALKEACSSRKGVGREERRGGGKQKAMF